MNRENRRISNNDSNRVAPQRSRSESNNDSNNHAPAPAPLGGSGQAQFTNKNKRPTKPDVSPPDISPTEIKKELEQKSSVRAGQIVRPEQSALQQATQSDEANQLRRASEAEQTALAQKSEMERAEQFKQSAAEQEASARAIEGAQQSTQRAQESIAKMKPTSKWGLSAMGALNGLSKIRTKTSQFGTLEWSVDNSPTALDNVIADRSRDIRQAELGTIEKGQAAEISATAKEQEQSIDSQQKALQREQDKYFKEGDWKNGLQSLQMQLNNSRTMQEREQIFSAGQNSLDRSLQSSLQSENIESAREIVQLQGQLTIEQMGLENELAKNFKEATNLMDAAQLKRMSELVKEKDFAANLSRLRRSEQGVSDTEHIIKMVDTGAGAAQKVVSTGAKAAAAVAGFREGGDVEIQIAPDNSTNEDVPDSVPAILAPGEVVLPNPAVKDIKENLTPETLQQLIKFIVSEDPPKWSPSCKNHKWKPYASGGNVTGKQKRDNAKKAIMAGGPDHIAEGANEAGSTAAGVGTGAAGGALSGLSAGSAFGPIGTIVGGVVGAVAGGVSGGIAGNEKAKAKNAARETSIANSQQNQLNQLNAMAGMKP